MRLGSYYSLKTDSVDIFENVCDDYLNSKKGTGTVANVELILSTNIIRIRSMRLNIILKMFRDGIRLSIRTYLPTHTLVR